MAFATLPITEAEVLAPHALDLARPLPEQLRPPPVPDLLVLIEADNDPFEVAARKSWCDRLHIESEPPPPSSWFAPLPEVVVS
jgi:hypothetical protein